MRHITTTLFISLSMACINSCSNQPTPTPKEEPAADVLVGRVAAVYAREKYMLIQKYKNFPTDADAIFYTRSTSGLILSVKVTGQKLGQFYVADIDSSEHTINDPVFMRNLHKQSQVNGNEATADPKVVPQPAQKN